MTNNQGRFIIILAGPPGTGKTYLANEIIKEDNRWYLLSYDDIKEEYFDEFGFDNLDEKKELGDKAWATYYEKLEKSFNQSEKMIIDYPFSYKQEDTLKQLIFQYDYTPITLTLYGDMRELFKRQKERDLKESRHIGHIVTRFHKGAEIRQPDDLDDFKKFKERCEDRKYDEFHIGDYQKIDVTNFENVDLTRILNWTKSKLYK
ncbi:AAA family ATPase [Mammaliicoccus vitulinus]|uniref:AAA family ATPase n=1 Tax=Mammaliicoccus vitulinus TaxID=71237 RepID=UPI002B25908C|nr:AAA family ATPase [Mammaliicoccus vitulinus]WQK88274.1 AAA family ATPase [Mammaliicoccus vitulinus]